MISKLKFAWWYLKGYRIYSSTVYSYGNRAPKRLKFICRTQTEATLSARVYIYENFGSSFIISKIETKVDRWAYFKV